MTAKAVSEYLGISSKTLFNQSKTNGYEFVRDSEDKIMVVESAHAFVKHQSEIIRKMNAEHGRKISVETGNSDSDSEPSNIDQWKAEREKQSAIKIRLANELDLGELVPFEALMELYSKPLSLVKSKLLDLSNQVSKRIQISPVEQKTIDDLVREALSELGERGMDELQSIISPIIERYSKYYRPASESADS